MICTQRKFLKKHKGTFVSIRKVHMGTVSDHKDCYGTFKKLTRNSESSKSDNFEKLSVLAQILTKKMCVAFWYNTLHPAVFFTQFYLKGLIQRCARVSVTVVHIQFNSTKCIIQIIQNIVQFKLFCRIATRSNGNRLA